MRLLHVLLAAWHRLTAFRRRRRIDRDVDEELAFHLAMRQREHEAGGLPADEAARAARVRFGNVTNLTEETRDMWTFPSLEHLRQDVRFALRTLRKSPTFTAVAVGALAIGIGANTAIYSLVDSVLVRGLPYPDQDRLVLLIGDVQRAERERRGGSYPDFLDWRAQASRLDGMAAYASTTATIVSDDADPDRLAAEAVSPTYFQVLGVEPALGRAFRAEENEIADRNPVVILADGVSKRRFGGDASVIGRTVQLSGRATEIVGVMPAGFSGLTDQAELWIPFVNAGFSLDNRGDRWLQAVARLKQDTSLSESQAEMTAIAAGLERQHPDTNEKRSVEVAPLAAETFGQIRPAIIALMAAVAFVLLIACANVANLLISRSEARQREMAVRAALGAGRARLLRQVVTESLVLATLGGLAGIALARLALVAVRALPEGTIPSFVQPSLNLPVLFFTLVVALGSGLVLGVAPAMHASLTSLGTILKDSARGSSGARAQRLRSGLVVAEVALAVVLLVGAGLMIRTVRNLTSVDPGYDSAQVLTFNISVPRLPADRPAPTTATEPAAPPAFVVSVDSLLDQLRSVPGVIDASLSSDLPLRGASAVFYSAEGDATSSAEARPRAYVHRITPAFFDVLGVSVRNGRAFQPADSQPGSTAIIVSEAVPRRFWPGQNPIGKRLKIGALDSPAPWLIVVGVVPELRYRGLPENPTGDPDLYFPYTERAVHGVALRTGGAPLAVETAARAVLRRAHPGIVVYGVASLDDQVRAETAQSRFTTWLMGVFAGTALLLSVVGLYGVLSYVVSQRTREFGIRVALGAGRGEILGVVGRFGAKLIGIGLLIGGLASIGLVRLLEQLLFGVSAASASGTAIASVGLLAAVALGACLLPAWRATQVDPMTALRND